LKVVEDGRGVNRYPLSVVRNAKKGKTFKTFKAFHSVEHRAESREHPPPLTTVAEAVAVKKLWRTGGALPAGGG